MLLEERFDNIEKAKKIECPTCILHGMKDDLVDFEDSVELISKYFIKNKAHLFLRHGMTHNVFDYTKDVIQPLKFFFFFHQIAFNPRIQLQFDLVKNPSKQPQRKTGFVEDNSLSKYYNNFQKKFKPIPPKP